MTEDEPESEQYLEQKKMFDSSARMLDWRHNAKIDNQMGRREFCESDRESDLDEELEIVRKKHVAKVKSKRL